MSKTKPAKGATTTTAAAAAAAKSGPVKKARPHDGGSYRRLADGTLEQITPTTGERPCKCSPLEGIEVAQGETAQIHGDGSDTAPLNDTATSGQE